MRLLHYLLFASFLVLLIETECKRGGGRARGTKLGTGFWTRRSRHKDRSRRPSAPPPEPAKKAPEELDTKPIGINQPSKTAPKPVSETHAAKSVPQSQAGNTDLNNNKPPPPPGWNTQGNSAGGSHPNSGAPPPYQGVGHPNSGAPPPYPGVGHPNSGALPPYPGVGHPNSGAPPPYPGVGHQNSGVGYPQAGAGYPNTNYGYGAPNGYNPQQPYPGYYPTSNIGVVPPRGANHGQYYNSMGGMGGNTHLMGNQFGGYGYGYPMKKSGGFFGRNAFRNVLGGLFIWYMISGLTSRPYHVYNYHNQPPEERAEISLPQNILTLCNENATSLCAPGTTAICTTNQTILCVTSITGAAPCQEAKGELCVNSTIPCLDEKDPLCQNSTSTNVTTVNLPCFTNMTLQGELKDSKITLPQSEGNRFCVTTMAVPDDSLTNNSTIPSAATDIAPVNATSVSLNVTKPIEM